MNSKLRLIQTILSWDDEGDTNNPMLRHFDWKRDVSGIDAVNPSSHKYTVASGDSLSVFDGSRSTSIDGTTDLDLYLVDNESDVYRFAWVGGTNPVFRTDRAIDLDGETVTVTSNANGVALFTTTGTFAGVVAGDTLWIPDNDEIDTDSPFHEGNRGFWKVLVASTTELTVTREGDFEAAADTDILITDPEQVQAFSAAGVQAGDKLVVSAGFTSDTFRTYTVRAVSSKYLEVQSSLAVAEESAVSPGAAGFKLYTSAKKYLRIEVDQEASVVVNGGSAIVISPWSAGDRLRTGWYEQCGNAFSLSVTNRSSQPLSVVVIGVE